MTDASVTPVRFEAPPAVVTIDLEDWFCVCGDDYYSDPRRWEGFEPRLETSAAVCLDRLSAAGRRATFFVLGWAARRYPALVARIAAEGHEIAFHGMEHRRWNDMTARELRSDLREGRVILEEIAGAAVVGFRAPEWSIRRLDPSAFEILAEAGFRYDASVTAIPVLGRPENPVYPVAVETAGGRVLEFPPLTGREWGQTVHFGGGWPFRQLSWTTLMARADRFRRDGAPAIFTFHPWEIDPEPPPLPGSSALLRLTRNAWRRRLPGRFERLLARGQTSLLRDLL